MFSSLSFLLCASAPAQTLIAATDFTHALGEAKRLNQAAGVLPGAARWIGATSTLWFQEREGETRRYVLYDAASGHRALLDNARIAAALDQGRSVPLKPDELYLPGLEFDEKGDGFAFRTQRGRVHCTYPEYRCIVPEGHPEANTDEQAPGFEGNDPKHPVVSPDGKWEASIQSFNVFLHRKGDPGPARPASVEGNAGDYYQRSTLQWSPDCRHLLARRVLQGMRRQLTLVESSPESQLQPIVSSRFYAKPGDVLDREQPVLFDPEAGTQRVIDTGLFPNPYEVSRFDWRQNSSAFTFVYNQRGHQRMSVLSVDASTGDVRRVIDETSSTFVEYSDLNAEPETGGKYFRHDLADGREILWLSERDGWAHLYLYNGQSGTVENQVTRGKWVVRGVNRVDESRRQIYFEASGVDPKLDPYFTQGYRINFDGTGMIALTEAPANHELSYSGDGRFFTDFWSRVDEAPRLDLRRVPEGEAVQSQLVTTLAQGSLAGLRATGWVPPEVFVAKGRDGVTDIWGLIYRPANFDPARKYPVVEAIYAGPQGSFVPKSFSVSHDPLTDLGFVVVRIDGMGTNNRSKAFHDVAWKNLKDAGFADRILWHQAAAKKYSWYDSSRVGIYGTSAGGQSALGALLFHPEFYRAAVANSGCHDNRMDKIWWNEQWMGWPVDNSYAASSNVENASRLRGRLLLVMGEMDTNVDPASTLQVANALIQANKDFELLDVPGGGHGAGGTYGQRRLLDFFVRSLKEQSTPNWNSDSPEGSK